MISLNVSLPSANTQTLSGANTYTGATNITSGTLALGAGGSLGATAVTVSSGGTLAALPATNSGANALGGSLTLNAGSNFSMADGAASTLNIAGAAAFKGANLTFDLVSNSGLAADQISAGAAASVSGANKITIDYTGAAPPTGNYVLISDAAGGLTGANNFAVASGSITVGGSTYPVSLSNSATAETLVIGPASTAASVYYTGNASQTTLNATASGGTVTNFSSSSTGTPDFGAQPNSLDNVYFTATAGSGVGSAQNITSLGQGYAFNSLDFTSNSPAITITDSTNNLTLYGGITDTAATNQTLNVPLTLSGSTQTIGNSGAGLLTLGGPIATTLTTLTTSGSGNIALGAISGSTGLAVSGPGSLTLNGANAYFGATAIAGPTIVAGSFGNTAITVNTGGSLALNNASAVSQNTLTVAGGSLTESVANAISGSTSVVFSSGAANLSQANSFTGATTLSGATLTLGANGSLGTSSSLTIGGSGSVLQSSVAALSLPSTTPVTLNSSWTASGANAITINGTLTSSANSTITNNITGANSLTFAGNVALSNGVNAQALTLTGAGSTIISGVTANGGTSATGSTLTYSGAGELTLAGANTFGLVSTAANGTSVTLNSGTLNLTNTSALGANGGTLSINGPSTAILSTDTPFGNGGSSGTTANPVYSVFFGNSIAVLPNYSATIELNRATSGATTPITQNFGTLDFSLLGGHPGTLDITAGPNAPTGALDTIAFTSFLPGNGNTVTETLVPTGGNISIGTVAPFANAAVTVDLDGTTAGNVITGAISGGAIMLIDKTNISAWTLSGTSTYTGATSITGGTLALGNGGNLGATAVSVGSGATLAVTPAVSSATNALGGSLTLSAGSSFTMADSVASTATVAGAASLAGAHLTFDLAGATPTADQLQLNNTSVTVSGSNTITIDYTSGSTSPTGTYTLISAPNATSGSLTPADFSLTVGRVVYNGVAYSLALANSGTAEQLVVGATSAAASAYYTGNASGSTLNATASGGTVTNFSSSSSGSPDLGTQPGSLTDLYFSASGATGAVNITSLGQSYSLNSLNFTSTAGATTISDASHTISLYYGGLTDQSANAATINAGVILATPQTWTNSGAATLTLGDGVTAGTNLLTFAGSGATTISGTAAYATSAGFTVASGAGHVTISAPVTVGAAQTWTNNSSNAMTISGGITAGANLLTFAGSGATTISGTAAFSTSAGFTVASGAGQVTISAPVTLGAAQTWTNNSTTPVAINGAVTNSGDLLTLTGSGGGSISGAITGTGGLTVNGGTWTSSSSATTFSGAITIGAATLSLANENITNPSASVTVGNVASATGTLNFQSGAYSFGNGALYAGSGGSTTGIVNQTGGTVTVSAGLGLLLGNSSNGSITNVSTGIYNLSAGELTAGAANSRGVMMGVNTYAQTTFNLSGTGNLYMPTAELAIGRNDRRKATRRTPSTKPAARPASNI